MLLFTLMKYLIISPIIPILSNNILSLRMFIILEVYIHRTHIIAQLRLKYTISFSFSRVQK
jgi:hypothetical protein